ncbi:MAG: exosortase/archaeosortase family protein [Phycisphaerae bacterium]
MKALVSSGGKGVRLSPWLIVGVGLLMAVLAWDHWSNIKYLVNLWQNDQNYSVGLLVPFVAVYLLWHDRKKLRQCRIQPCWWGVGLVFLGMGLRVFGVLFSYGSAEWYSLVLLIGGLVLLAAGWQVFYQVRWILLFLFLMFPLPRMIHYQVSLFLQNLSTQGAVFFLELLDQQLAREGNTLILNGNVRVGIAEACNGLRMLTAFIVVAYTLAYIIDRPRWQKVVLLISSIPVAIVCNIVRLFITAELFLLVDGKTAERFFHDFAGLTMMPMAILILGFELYLMKRATLPDEQDTRGRKSGQKKPAR